MRHLHRWGVCYFLAGVALVLNAVHAYFEWAVTTYPSQDEVPWQVEWQRSTWENLQSEVWQIFLACIIVDAAVRKNFWFRAKDD